jgi:hypothetical protein
MKYLQIDSLAVVCYAKKVVVVLGGQKIRARIGHLGVYPTRPVVCFEIVPEKPVPHANLQTAEAGKCLVECALQELRLDIFNKAYANTVYTAVRSICNNRENVGRVIQSMPFGFGHDFYDIAHTPFRSIVLIMQHMKTNSNCYNGDKTIGHEGSRR